MVVVLVLVVVVDVDVDVVFVFVDVVVKATRKVDLRLLVMDVEFGWVVGVQTHFHVKPDSVELS